MQNNARLMIIYTAQQPRDKILQRMSRFTPSFGMTLKLFKEVNQRNELKKFPGAAVLVDKAIIYQ